MLLILYLIVVPQRCFCNIFFSVSKKKGCCGSEVKLESVSSEASLHLWNNATQSLRIHLSVRNGSCVQCNWTILNTSSFARLFLPSLLWFSWLWPRGCRDCVLQQGSSKTTLFPCSCSQVGYHCLERLRWTRHCTQQCQTWGYHNQLQTVFQVIIIDYSNFFLSNRSWIH